MMTEVSRGELAAAAETELLEDVREVHLDRRLADRKKGGNLFIAEADGRVTQHLAFAVAQTRDDLGLDVVHGARAFDSGFQARPRRHDDVARRPDLAGPDDVH